VERVELDSLRALLEGDCAADRAFVDAMIRLEWSRTDDRARQAELEQLRTATRAAARRSHAALRAQIASGALRGAALRRCFEERPLLERDHFVEELLGIAYPPLHEPALARELVGYSPSGYDEIVYALDVTQLGPGQRFFDVGCGLGKPALLAALLTGASSVGIDCNALLCEHGQSSARELGLDEVAFRPGDARDAPLEEADVAFMYLPFTGDVLSRVMDRLMAQARPSPSGRRRYLCCGALDLHRFPELELAAPARSWLHVYAWRTGRPGAKLPPR
jgi:protein-L-isoaspartate O-methyltransferase